MKINLSLFIFCFFIKLVTNNDIEESLKNLESEMNFGDAEDNDSMEDYNEFTQTQTIIELNDENIYSTITQKSPLLIMFYTPWCENCEEIQMIYEQLSQTYSENKIQVNFCKIDSVSYPGASENFTLNQYPTIYFIRNEDKVLFNAEINEENLKLFIDQQLSVTKANDTIKVEKIEEFNLNSYLTNSKNNLFLFLGDKSKYIAEYNLIKNSFNDGNSKNEFLDSNNADLKGDYNIDDDQFDVIVFKYSNKIRKHHHGLSMEIKGYPLYNSHLIQELKETFLRNSVKALTSKDLENFEKTGLPISVFLYENSADLKKIQNLLNSLKAKYKTAFHYRYALITDETAKNFSSQLKYNGTYPCLIVIDKLKTKGEFDGVNKFILNNLEFNENSLTNHIEEYLSQRMPLYFSSEAIPSSPLGKNGIYKIVGATLGNLILNSYDKDIFVLFYSSGHKGSKIALQRFANLGKIFENNTNLILGSIDLSANELQIIKLEKTPYLAFFKNKMETPEIIEFKSNFTTNQMKEFVLENSLFNHTQQSIENESDINLKEEQEKVEIKQIDFIDDKDDLSQYYKRDHDFYLEDAINSDVESKLFGEDNHEMNIDIKDEF